MQFVERNDHRHDEPKVDARDAGNRVIVFCDVLSNNGGLSKPAVPGGMAQHSRYQLAIWLGHFHFLAFHQNTSDVENGLVLRIAHSPCSSFLQFQDMEHWFLGERMQNFKVLPVGASLNETHHPPKLVDNLHLVRSREHMTVHQKHLGARLEILDDKIVARSRETFFTHGESGAAWPSGEIRERQGERRGFLSLLTRPTDFTVRINRRSTQLAKWERRG
mmetsp:Transcript_2566/g.5421  ORF Transcript_2566/g.5421 Transcript_2566/m.5421 type:complete len:219 (-) Transcript_2566:432-1088(-)